jgi:hypothetical protein
MILPLFLQQNGGFLGLAVRTFHFGKFYGMKVKLA